MSEDINRDPDIEWLDHVRPVGLVIAASLIKELGLAPTRQTAVDTGEAAEQIDVEGSGPALRDPWAFAQAILGWEARHVAGAPEGSEIPASLVVPLPEHNTSLQPTWAVRELSDGAGEWQLLVRVEDAGIDPDQRASLDGWEATPQQRFERLLRETGIFAGLMITDNVLRLTYAPRGETSGHLTFPIRPLATVAGRPMLGGLKLLLGSVRLFIEGNDRRLPALLAKSRDAQAAVSTALAGQVLGALHELLRGFDAAEPDLIRHLANTQPGHLYEGLLTVLMRLVFVLYAEDRDLLPSRTDADARRVYETSYAVRGLYARLSEDAALHPDTMDERQGGWGQLLALFRLIYGGHRTHFVQARGGKLFDPEAFPFLEGRALPADAPRVPGVSDGCLLRILEGLMTLKLRGGTRERLSYRALDVEQIGSVYETVMGFEAGLTSGRSLAIKAGKNNKTPVFVDLDALAALKGKARIKSLKQDAGRALTTAQAKPIEDANSVENLVIALDSLVDERGSPKKTMAAPSTPILQPTDERRKTGSHYTPRSLTAPIVMHALEPAFARLGPDATADQVLDLKICDPAMGSGAFLVEACRALGERLIQAWARWPESRPTIPADEDEELHARRLVAQRCLYGVDKNPRAVDLARLSLWLATLARDHEFSFLDHALKSGDSLVGLTPAQIAAATWDEARPGLPLFRQLVRERVTEAETARAEIQSAPDDTARLIQEQRHRHLETRLSPIRAMGDAVLSAFFAADKAKAREKALAEVESQISGLPPRWDQLEAAANRLRSGEHGIPPFHWQLEFPEVFARENGGFDAIVGNPPFLGGKRISEQYGRRYRDWLAALHERSNQNVDLVGHFFLRAFGLLRKDGAFGLICTNTVAQGDTREGSLALVLADGGVIARAQKRIRWPGEAAVVVSVVNVVKGLVAKPCLDDRPVARISAYLVEGDFDLSPSPLSENSRKAFVGSYVLGMGFTFDDQAAAKGIASSLQRMEELIESDRTNAEIIFPYLGGEELNNDPGQLHHRFVIDFEDKAEAEARTRWPDLIFILETLAKDERASQKREDLRDRWWQFAYRKNSLYAAVRPLPHMLAVSRVSPMLSVARVPTGIVPADSLVVFAFSTFHGFSILQSRVHELWARFFSSSMKDDLRYSPSDCFRTFPFPHGFETLQSIEAAGERYHSYRAQVMVDRTAGLTKTYNRFHARGEKGADVARLRALHHEMDVAVLRAYGWNDLAERAAPEFIEQNADEGKTPKTRFDWPAEFKDEVLARLLALNAARAADERAAGLTAVAEDDDEDVDEGDDAD
ncbi:N-6 DNA methylase [Sphingomonas sp. CGMCC 1.13654]|uniref:site-specific DNA-methyltransferase (adenine-specific) n=1 Tax=Sphingomonas chungangi TaxID=2683589 RepID=A0A838L1J8_9SPHN|nr:DNA methyltransferase [Sphingomonas chungangi]MBA2933064.1 N-6 DNA methylase [Sphingomonas chungangi]MVW56684.1 N-6 DNA methylase [Sphingomonas chungangi]